MISSVAPEAKEAKDAVTVLKDTLEKLKAAAPKKLKELRDECDEGLQRLGSDAHGAVNADEFFKAMKLGCEAQGSPKVVSLALDTIQKLMAYGFLTGRGPDPFKEGAPGHPRCLMDSVIEAVCGCAEHMDDTVQLQMIRALLTAVTSQSCAVHGNSLMLAVRACFVIHRDTKNLTNQRTAQASLTQMLNVVTQRMELSSADMSRRSANQEDAATRTGLPKPSVEYSSIPPQTVLNEWLQAYTTRLVDRVVLEQSSVNGSPNQKDDKPAVTPGDLVGGIEPGKYGWCVVCRQSAAHYCLQTKDPVCSHECKFRNLERLAVIDMHFGPKVSDAPAMGEADDQSTSVDAESSHVGDTDTESTISIAPNGAALDNIASRALSADSTSEHALPTLEGNTERGEVALNVHHKDALMVFQSLCKLSMRDLPPGTTDTRIVRSKRLSLELVLSMLQNCGPVFRSSDRFIQVLKEQLCVSLIKNSVSPMPKIFGLSLQIFVMLITNFKDNLKSEIGVFIEQIFLKILESGNSTYQHKHRVLQVFYKLCTDASTALELFLNFDCDVEEKNIFERMIDCLSKIAQGKYTSTEHANLIQPQQEQELKMLSLEALVTLMGSIVDWARRMTEDQNTVDGSAEKKVDEVESDGEDDAEKTPAISGSGVAAGSNKKDQVVSMAEQKQRKLDLQVGIHKFNMKAKKGLEYLTKNGFVENEPEAIAEFFKSNDGLDKTVIGDYMGEDKPFNKKVLYALVESHDFKEQDLDDALRRFLATFRLPGEAQKIDRMMEKFAEKYCQDNPTVFTNAECAYVLSFSLIMLNTDQHSPQIKNRMTKDEFVRNNRGINDGQDLDREYLERLFDAIGRNPFSLGEDDAQRLKNDSLAAHGATQKFELFVKETENIVQRSQEMMKAKVSKGQKSNGYVAAQNVDHVRLVFEVSWCPMLATLAVLLETQDSPSSVELCIEGFKHCIRISARFDMDTERDAFVSSLAKFTYLTTLKEMKQKNIECIKALLAIGLSEGNNLGPAWQFVLHCISQLERLQLLVIKARQDFQFFQGEANAADPQKSQGATVVNNTPSKRRAYGTGVSALVNIGSDERQVEISNSESVMAQIDAAQIDLLFNRSSTLGSTAIVHFVTQLSKVSKEELSLSDQPRIFSLQKLVEVADYNMNRIRLVWSRIWRVLSAHFVEVACHPNHRICMYAIDSLRQLAMKFLEKDELSNYNFQVEFLRPFEVVMYTTGVSMEIKELVVQIISNMVMARINNIKSGWKTIFHILHMAAQDGQNEQLITTAFGILERVIQDHHEIFVENFSEGVRCLLAFGHCKANTKSEQAITYLLQAAQYLADDKIPDPPPPTKESSAMVALPGQSVPTDGGNAPTPHAAAHWLPILRGLSMLISDPQNQGVRDAALHGLFDCLREYGGKTFDSDTWQMVFRGVIFPLFDDIIHQLQQNDEKGKENAQDGTEGNAASWASSMGPRTCFDALKSLVTLFDVHLTSLSFLLPDLLKLLMNCIQNNTEAVARIGVEGFKLMLQHTGKRLAPDLWQQVAKTIYQLFSDSMPKDLFCEDKIQDGSIDAQLPFHSASVVIQCVVQLLLIDLLQDTVPDHYDTIPPAAISVLLDALQHSFEFAQEFNQKIALRQKLKRLGFMREMKQLPGLLKQEREGLSCSLKILFRIQGDSRMKESEADYIAQGERLMKICTDVLRNYIQKDRRLQEHQEAEASSPGPAGVDPNDAAASSREHDQLLSAAAVVETEREVVGLVPIICDVLLKGFLQLDGPQFAQHMDILFPLLADLTIVNNKDVRLMVREILVEQVAPTMPALKGASATSKT